MKKNVLITGTSTGIGRCTAILLAENGFKVYAGVRTEKDFASLASENENIKPIYIDVLDKASISKAVQLLKEDAVELTAIINNAGAVVAQPIECINIDDLKYQFELNTVAPVAIAQAFLPLMKSGKIINLSSMASTGMFPYISPYCASKRALDILFNSLSIEMKNKNIQVVSIKPGVIRTPIWNKSIATNRSQLEKLPDNFKEKYGKDLIFLAKNAEKNNYKSILPEKVAERILKVVISKKPKSSYCVGIDSLAACFISKLLPQDILNKIIKYKLNQKLKG
ncbi:SDR family NAD(P)-dependent oxidoreductase [bacterium]|nr:SDR family NAD(P)-dependent oxidoreductase [bacterium]